MKENPWTKSDWLTKVIRTVMRRGKPKILSACFVTAADLEQDLFCDIYSDPQFIDKLHNIKSEPEALQFAYRFLNTRWHRHERAYYSRWPRSH